MPALLLPEIFASRIRAKAVALSLGMHWVSNHKERLNKLGLTSYFQLIVFFFAIFCLSLFPGFQRFMVSLFHQISNFVIGLYFLSVVNKFGISSVYLGFSAICLLAVLYIIGNVVETKGRSLEEIERALNPAT